jgi:hypothetical protein
VVFRVIQTHLSVLEIDVRSRYGHILVIAYGLVAGPGTRRYMVWISRADPGPSLITLISD